MNVSYFVSILGQCPVLDKLYAPRGPFSSDEAHQRIWLTGCFRADYEGEEVREQTYLWLFFNCGGCSSTACADITVLLVIHF